jgi:hypothetical protein
MDLAIALERGEEGVIAILGALILSQGLNDLAPFQRVMQQLPQTICLSRKPKRRKRGNLLLLELLYLDLF